MISRDRIVTFLRFALNNMLLEPKEGFLIAYRVDRMVNWCLEIYLRLAYVSSSMSPYLSVLSHVSEHAICPCHLLFSHSSILRMPCNPRTACPCHSPVCAPVLVIYQSSNRSSLSAN